MTSHESATTQGNTPSLRMLAEAAIFHSNHSNTAADGPQRTPRDADNNNGTINNGIDKNGIIQTPVEMPPTTAPPAPRPLPCLMRYADKELMKSAATHNNPPDKRSVCPICHYRWDSAPMSTTFLPLSPCNHWVHYRCFVWWTSRQFERNNKCCVCDTQLFEWDGINVLTIAARTGFELENVAWSVGSYKDWETNMVIASDSDEYNSDCYMIEHIIGVYFFKHMAQPPRFADKSHDLTKCYSEVLDELDKLKRPRGKWLQWKSSIGFLLFGILVAIKMRRYLTEHQAKVVGTEGWKHFDAGCAALQQKLLGEIRAD